MFALGRLSEEKKKKVMSGVNGYRNSCTAAAAGENANVDEAPQVLQQKSTVLSQSE